MGDEVGVGAFCGVCVEKSAVLDRKWRFWGQKSRKTAFLAVCGGLQGGEVGGDDGLEVAGDFFDGPIPPGDSFERGDGFGREAGFEDLGGIAADDGVGRDVFRDDRAGGDDGAVADMDAGHDEGVVADPHVVADDGVAAGGQVCGRGDGGFPALAEDAEGIGGKAGQLVVGAVHDELDPAGQRAELADDEFVADERIMVEHVALEVLRVFRIVVVGVVADDDMGILHRVPDEADLGKAGHGMGIGWAGAVHGIFLRGVGLQNRPHLPGAATGIFYPARGRRGRQSAPRERSPWIL